jgi:hypothetical protein
LKIPEKVKIGGHNLSIDFSTDISNMGEWRSEKQNIKIHKDNCKSQQEETLLHEIMECINYHYELKLPHWQIQVLGTVFYQIIKDNPELFKEEVK